MPWRWRSSFRSPWRPIPSIVYAKRPFGGPEQVLDYLGRYTHRVAIANSRLVGLAEGGGQFFVEGLSPPRQAKGDDPWRRRIHPPLPASADGFHRIRHYGYLANGQGAAKLADCGRLLAVPEPAPPAPPPITASATGSSPAVHSNSVRAAAAG